MSRFFASMIALPLMLIGLATTPAKADIEILFILGKPPLEKNTPAKIPINNTILYRINAVIAKPSRRGFTKAEQNVISAVAKIIF